jgi:hypothetical protein
MFCDKSIWVHLAAEMQAGKTGVINALFRLILSNCHRIGITPNRIFTLTGMSDEDWQEHPLQQVSEKTFTAREACSGSNNGYVLLSTLSSMAIGIFYHIPWQI